MNIQQTLEDSNWDGESNPVELIPELGRLDWSKLTADEANSQIVKKCDRQRLVIGQTEGGETFSDDPTTYCVVDLIWSVSEVLMRLEYSQEDPTYWIAKRVQ